MKLIFLVSLSYVIGYGSKLITNFVHFHAIESLKIKPPCIYGKECRTQVKVPHAKKYQHWFFPNTAELKSLENEDSRSGNNEDVVDYDEESSGDDSMDTDEE